MLDREPVLVVPTGRRRGAVRARPLRAARAACSGVSIRTFASLFDEAARAAGLDLPPAAEPAAAAGAGARRDRATPLRLLRRSVRAAGLRPGARRADRRAPGGAGRRRPSSSSPRASSSDGDYERELAALFAALRAAARERRPQRRRLARAGDDRGAARAPGALGRAPGARLRLRRPDPRPARADRGAQAADRGGDRGQLRRPRRAQRPGRRCRAQLATSSALERSDRARPRPVLHRARPASAISIASLFEPGAERVAIDGGVSAARVRRRARRGRGDRRRDRARCSPTVRRRTRSRSWSAIRAGAGRCSGGCFSRLEIPAAVEASAPLDGDRGRPLAGRALPGA